MWWNGRVHQLMNKDSWAMSNWTKQIFLSALKLDRHWRSWVIQISKWFEWVWKQKNLHVKWRSKELKDHVSKARQWQGVSYSHLGCPLEFTTKVSTGASIVVQWVKTPSGSTATHVGSDSYPGCTVCNPAPCQRPSKSIRYPTCLGSCLPQGRRRWCYWLLALSCSTMAVTIPRGDEAETRRCVCLSLFPSVTL